MNLTFRDAQTGRSLNGMQAVTVACRRALEQGLDEAEMHGIIRRMADEEDAREMFYDITEIEVFTN